MAKDLRDRGEETQFVEILAIDAEKNPSNLIPLTKERLEQAKRLVKGM